VSTSKRKLALLSDRFKTLWLEENEVIMLDRSKYPLTTEYVKCKNLEQVAVAIEQMVIQGAPPLGYAAGLGLVLHARTLDGKSKEDYLIGLKEGVTRLKQTRPTGWNIFFILDDCLKVAEEALSNNEDPAENMLSFVYKIIEEGNRISRDTGRYAADLINDGDHIQTMCFAGAALNYMLYFAAEDGKDIHLYVSETRPYLQGSRLAAQSAIEMDIPVTVVTDNMPGYLMTTGRTNVLVTAADKVTLDGHVANKIGTYQLALAAFDNNLPFYVLAYKGPAPDSQSKDSIVIEERDPEEVLYCLGNRTAVYGANGYYPAFDITPPRLVSAIITDRGIFPSNLAYKYFSTEYVDPFYKREVLMKE